MMALHGFKGLGAARVAVPLDAIVKPSPARPVLALSRAACTAGRAVNFVGEARHALGKISRRRPWPPRRPR